MHLRMVYDDSAASICAAELLRTTGPTVFIPSRRAIVGFEA
jgi:hypothetical protein